MKEKFDMYLEELKKHDFVLKTNFEKLDKIYGLPFNEKKILDIVECNIEILDSIAYRFSKFQDTLGKAIKVWFSLKGENVDNLTIIDVINFAEKIGFNIDKESWWKMRSIRNNLAHEYENEYIKVADALNDIFELYPKLSRILTELEERI